VRGSERFRADPFAERTIKLFLVFHKGFHLHVFVQNFEKSTIERLKLCRNAQICAALKERLQICSAVFFVTPSSRNVHATQAASAAASGAQPEWHELSERSGASRRSFRPNQRHKTGR
jgi:hypothetical protein